MKNAELTASTNPILVVFFIVGLGESRQIREAVIKRLMALDREGKKETWIVKISWIISTRVTRSRIFDRHVYLVRLL